MGQPAHGCRPAGGGADGSDGGPGGGHSGQGGNDGDGVLDGDEVPAGTNPNQGGDAFKILPFAQKTGDFIMAVGTPYEVKWSSVEGKTYSVFRTTNLLLGFEIVRSNVLATPPVNTYIDNLPPEPKASYSVGVE